MGRVGVVLSAVRRVLSASRGTIRKDAESFCLLNRKQYSRNWEEKKVILAVTLAVGYVRQRCLARLAYRWCKMVEGLPVLLKMVSPLNRIEAIDCVGLK